jgi:hypothetical protein
MHEIGNSIPPPTGAVTVKTPDVNAAQQAKHAFYEQQRAAPKPTPPAMSPLEQAVIDANNNQGATSPEYKAAIKAYRDSLKPPVQKQMFQDAMNLTPQQKVDNVAAMFGENSPQHKAAKARYAARSKKAPKRPTGIAPAPDELIAWTNQALGLAPAGQ